MCLPRMQSGLQTKLRTPHVHLKVGPETLLRERTYCVMDRYAPKKATPTAYAVAENYKMLELEEPLETIKSRPFVSQEMKLKNK